MLITEPGFVLLDLIVQVIDMNHNFNSQLTPRQKSEYLERQQSNPTNLSVIC